MAPARKKGSSSCCRKMAAFLKDLDREANRQLQQMRADGERLVKEIEILYHIGILRLPLEFHQMNWIKYYAKAGSGKTMEEMAMADSEIAEIDKLIAGLTNAPFDIIKRGLLSAGHPIVF